MSYTNRLINAVAAKNENGVVAVKRCHNGKDLFQIVGVSPKSLQKWENRNQLEELTIMACAKIGVKRDGRGRGGWVVKK